ncbi:MAG: hypothetical protein J7498_10310 [Sphingobium sp.]|nr:hypothetical protein [Sphingobium sp.]
MTKRRYQLFALSLLIGVPFLMSLLTSSLVPGLQQIAPTAPTPQMPEDMQPTPDPAEARSPAQTQALAKPPQNRPGLSGPQAGGGYTPVAALDPTGTIPVGVAPTPVSIAVSDVSVPGQNNQGPSIPPAQAQHATNDIQR